MEPKTVPQLTDYDGPKDGYYMLVHHQAETNGERYPFSLVVSQGDEFLKQYVRSANTTIALGTCSGDYADFVHVPGKGIYAYYAEEPAAGTVYETVAASGGGYWGLSFAYVAAAQVAEDEDHRFVTDAQIAAWDSKADADEYYTKTEADDRYPLQSDLGAANGIATLDSGGKVPAAQLPASVMDLKGVWNASTNTPMLADGGGNNGDVYKVTGAPAPMVVNLGSGNITVANGGILIYVADNGRYEFSDGTDSVSSVNGLQGVVVLDTGNIAEGANQYFTNARARAAVSSSDNTIAYNPATGVFSLNKVKQVLADVGNTFTWDVSVGYFAEATVAAGAKTLAISNAASGDVLTILFKRDAIGGAATVALPAGSYVIDTGESAVTLRNSANAIDMLVGLKDGGAIYWILKPVSA